VRELVVIVYTFISFFFQTVDIQL